MKVSEWMDKLIELMTEFPASLIESLTTEPEYVKLLIDVVNKQEEVEKVE